MDVPSYDSPSPFNHAPVGTFLFTFPEPHRTPVERDVDFVKVKISEIIVTGSSVFSRDDFIPLFANLIGHQSTLNDVIAVAEQIEAKYRKKGYLLVHATVPTQQPINGVYRIKVTEGVIRDVIINGVNDPEKSRIAAILAPVINEKPLQQAHMERALLLAGELPGLRVSGLLRPASDQTDSADLIITASRTRFTVFSSVDNNQSRYAGPWLISSDVSSYGLLHWGEQLSLGMSATPDWMKDRQYRFKYVQPVGSQGLLLTTAVNAGRDESGYTLRQYGEMTNTVNLSQRVSYPLLRTLNASVVVDGGLSLKSTAVVLDGSGYYTDRWRVGDIKLSWAQGDGSVGHLSSVISYDLSQGLPFLGGDQRGDSFLSRVKADPDFTKMVLDIKAKWRVTDSWSLYGSATGQFAGSRLLEEEEFIAGGMTYGRGFDPSEILGDYGFGDTTEIQYDFPKFNRLDGYVQGFGFVDHAQIWDMTAYSTSPYILSSGGGVRLQLDNGLAISGQIAHPLHGPTATVANDPIRPYLAISTKF